MTELNAFNSLTIYRKPERDAFVAAARENGPYYDKASRAWIVADPEACRELLSRAELYPAPAIEHYRNMPGELGERFRSVAFAFENIPLSMHGERHAAARRAASEMIAANRDAVHDWVRDGLPRHVQAFARSGRVELMAEVIRPMVRELIGAIAGVNLPPDAPLESVSKVFDKSISMGRREALERDMRRLEGLIRDSLGAGASEAEVGMRLGLVVVGNDATVGTFGESLVKLLRDNDGVSLDKIDYPKMPHQTAVPFVERIAAAPVRAAGLDLAPGDRVRVVLLTFAQEPPDQHHRFFGAGPHACLGRPVSIELWGAMCARLGKLTSTVRVIDYQLAQDDYVFNVAKTFGVEVTA